MGCPWAPLSLSLQDGGALCLVWLCRGWWTRTSSCPLCILTVRRVFPPLLLLSIVHASRMCVFVPWERAAAG